MPRQTASAQLVVPPVRVSTVAGGVASAEVVGRITTAKAINTCERRHLVQRTRTHLRHPSIEGKDRPGDEQRHVERVRETVEEGIVTTTLMLLHTGGVGAGNSRVVSGFCAIAQWHRDRLLARSPVPEQPHTRERKLLEQEDARACVVEGFTGTRTPRRRDERARH